MIRPVSKVVVKFLRVMQKHGYINAFEIIDDARNGKIVIDLNGRLNKCGVISPRFDLKLVNFEKFVYQILPSRQFGYVVLTTNKGIMDHVEARTAHIGGKVLGFFYWEQAAIKNKRLYSSSELANDLSSTLNTLYLSFDYHKCLMNSWIQEKI